MPLRAFNSAVRLRRPIDAKQTLAEREVPPIDCSLLHHLFKQEPFVIRQIAGARMVRVGVAGVEERDDLEAAFVDVEMDVSLLEIRRMGLPDDGLRVARFDRKPRLMAQSLAMLADLQKKQVKRVVMRLLVDGHDRATVARSGS